MKRIIPIILALTLLCACTAIPAAPEAPAAPQTPAPQTPETPAVPEPPLEEEAEETQAQTFRLAWTPSAGLDPYTCDNGANLALLPLLYEGLYTVQADFTAAHALCISEMVSDDGLVWTMLLRQAQFSDGSPVTAADVAASLEAAQNGRYAERLSCIQSVEAVNDRQFKLTLSAPRERLPLVLNFPITKNRRLGTGPYAQSGAKLVPNAYFTGSCALQAEQIRLVSLTKATEIRDAFEQGRVSAVVTDPNAASAVAFHTDYELWTVPTSTMQYIGFNLQSPLFSDLSLRCAVGRIIDREQIVQNTMGGFGTIASLPAPPQSDIYDGGLAASYGYDPQKARALLRSASEHESMACTMLVSSASAQRIAAAQLVAQMLGEYGFQVTVQTMRHEDFLAALEAGEYDLCYCEIALSPDGDLTPLFRGDLPGLPANEAAMMLCPMALDNRGNYYTLHKSIADQGLLCPVAFKNQAIYVARGLLRDLTPAVGSAFWKAEAE